MSPRPNRPRPRSRPASSSRHTPPPRRRTPPPEQQSAGHHAPPNLDPTPSSVIPPGLLAELTADIAVQVEQAVLVDGARADRELSAVLKRRRDLGGPDQRFVANAVFALFRWRGWIEPLGPLSIEHRLLLATLLDSPVVEAPCRIWSRKIGADPDRLYALGDAPSWKARGEGFHRLLGGRDVTTDPWRLFPPWFREVLPEPPGDGPAKGRFLELLTALQQRPSLWVRAQGREAEETWKELRALGVKPWVHRRVPRAARLDPDVDVYHLKPFERGELEIQDLASQAVAMICDPEPGERWWDACAGAGGKALHLADLMRGKGVVVASDVHERRLKETVRRARKGPYSNITTRVWDGKGVAGKLGSFDGVLVDAPCSALGTWKRNPDARWSLDRAAIDRLAELQGRLLRSAAAGVKVGGALVYSACTLTPAETTEVVQSFLAEHANFRLDPFDHPLTGVATDGMLRFWPQESDTDAMFVARMVRGSEESGMERPQTTDGASPS